MYKEQLRGLIIKGIFGFIIGVIFAFIRSPELGIRFALIIGFVFAGVPYGWQLSGRITGGMLVTGNIGIMIIAFVLRAMLAMITGCIAYPIMLAYTFIKSKRES